MHRRFQFSLKNIFLAFVLAGAACAGFPWSIHVLDHSRSPLGPALFMLAMSSAPAAVGALFGKAVQLALFGALAAVAFMATVAFFFGIC